MPTCRVPGRSTRWPSSCLGEKVEHPELGAGDPIEAFARELTVAVEAVASGTEAPRLSGTLARQALATCWAEVQSVQGRQSVRIS